MSKSVGVSNDVAFRFILALFTLGVGVTTAPITHQPPQQTDGDRHPALPRTPSGNDRSAAWLSDPRAESPDAAFALGLAYDLGQGVAVDRLLACEWYRRAAAGGHVDGMFNAAALYDGGECGPRRADLAALWYARAAASGHARAAFAVGQLYEAGDGVPRNPGLAAAWYRLAYASGIAAADRIVATPADQGVATPADQGVATPGDRGVATPGDRGVATPGDRGVATPRTRLTDARLEAPSPLPAMSNTSGAILAWNAQSVQPDVRYCVEIDVLKSDGPHEVAVAETAVSAARFTLPLEQEHYLWRVSAVRPNSAHYAASAWQKFDAP